MSLLTVTCGTGGQPAKRIAAVIERQPRDPFLPQRRQRKRGIMKGHGLPLVATQPLRDPAHLHMGPPAIGIGLELAFEVSRIQPREPRRACAIAATVESMAGEAGVACPRLGATHGDYPPVFGKTVERGRLVRGAAGEQGGGGEEYHAHAAATVRLRRLFLLGALAPSLLQIAACKPPPDEQHFMPAADLANGKEAIERAGCAACHTIPGISWPQGKVGPDLGGLSDRALIAGKLPNRADVLGAYIRDAPSLVPESAMPAMPVSDTEARDIAAFLYQQGDR